MIFLSLSGQQLSGHPCKASADFIHFQRTENQITLKIRTHHLVSVRRCAVRPHLVHVASNRDLAPTRGLRVGEGRPMDQDAVGGEAVGLTPSGPADGVFLKGKSEERDPQKRRNFTPPQRQLPGSGKGRAESRQFFWQGANESSKGVGSSICLHGRAF